MAELNRLIILNNPCFLPKIAKDYQQIIYAPLFKNEIQKKQFEKIYKEIITFYPTTLWAEDIELLPNDHVLAWDASFECKVFGKHILNIKNRLFDRLDFDIPESFTAFRKKVEKKLPKRFSDVMSPFTSDVKYELDYYFEKTKLPLTYFEDRNQMVGRDFSTKFSRFLSQGTLDVRYLYNLIKDFESANESNKSTYWLVFELLWREFFYWHYQKHKEKYFSQNGIVGKEDFSRFLKYDFYELRQLTKEPFFHAALNELEQTGYMSNRSRQMFASFWINNLGLNWRSGAYFFEENLIDYDVFSNYGNWMYLAGVGVDPRGKRYFNIAKQLKSYDPEGAYLNKWLNRN